MSIGRAIACLPPLVSLAWACAHEGAADVEPVRVRLELEGAEADVDARTLVRRALSRGAPTRRHLELVSDPDAPVLWVRIEEVSNHRLPGSDPQIRAPRYQVRVRLWAEVRLDDGDSMAGRALGEERYVAPAGGIERLDGAYRTYLARAADQAAERLLDVLSLRARRFTLTRP